jgi:DNA-binding MarR family transcriptional regulator
VDDVRNQQILDLVFKIFRLDDLLKKTANQITAPAGQTGARWQVLNALESGPRTVADVARSKNGARQSVQRIVNELASEGIVQLRKNPDHKRFPLVELTPKGKKALARIQGERDAWIAEISNRLDDSMDSRVIHFLDLFQSAIETSLVQKESYES